MTITEARQNMLPKKVSGRVASAPKLSSLPPTMESFVQNAGCAHLQGAVCGGKQCNQILHERTQVAGKEMYASPISDDVTLAPNALFKVIKCGCN